MSHSQFSSAAEGLELSAVEAFHDRLAGAVQLFADRLFARSDNGPDLATRVRGYERRMVRPRIR